MLGRLNQEVCPTQYDLFDESEVQLKGYKFRGKYAFRKCLSLWELGKMKKLTTIDTGAFDDLSLIHI